MTTSPAGTSKVTESWDSLCVRLCSLLTEAYGQPTIAGLEADPSRSFLATERNHVRQVYIRRIARGLSENDATVLVELASDGNDHEVAKALFSELTQVCLDTDATQQRERILAWGGISEAWLAVAAANRDVANAINRVKAVGHLPDYYKEVALLLVAGGYVQFVKSDGDGARFDNPVTGSTHTVEYCGGPGLNLINCYIALSGAQKQLAHERFVASGAGLQQRIETARVGISAHFL